MAHHVTQRGNPRQETFFGEEDYQHYLELMAQFCRAEQVAIWGYCLIPNHVHVIVIPQSAESLRRAIGEPHRRYTRWINFREGWRGHPWQGRFASRRAWRECGSAKASPSHVGNLLAILHEIHTDCLARKHRYSRERTRVKPNSR